MRLVDPPDPPSTDEIALDEVGRAFEFLTFLDVRPAAQIPGTALGEGRFTFTDNLAVTAWPSRDGDNLWVRLEAAGDAEAAALNRRWGGWAFQVGIWKEKAFVPRLEDLLGREPAAPATAPGPAVPSAPTAPVPSAAPAAPAPVAPPAPRPAAPATPPAR
jgi:hypothetical protein